MVNGNSDGFSHTSAPKAFRNVGIAFVIIGFLAILMPVWAGLATEIIIATLLFVWGILGMSMALSLRPMPQWRYLAVVALVMLIAGIILILFPIAGLWVLTVMLMVGFLVDGIVMMLLGWQMRKTLHGWGWLVFSGGCAALLGLFVLSGAYGTGAPILGLFVGLNFVSSGASLIMISRAGLGRV